MSTPLTVDLGAEICGSLDVAAGREWLSEAELDRVGCFRYEAVDGAVANDLGTPGAASDSSTRNGIPSACR